MQLEKKASMKRAFKVNAGRFKGGQSNGRNRSGLRKSGGGFKGKCVSKLDISSGNVTNETDLRKTVLCLLLVNRLLIDSGATSHMSPHYSDLIDYEILNNGPDTTIADG